MEVENALVKLGSFGRWQTTSYIAIASFQGFIASFHMLSIYWISHTPEHHCRLAEGASINDSIPRDSNGKLSQCLKYVNLSLSNQTMGCDDGWFYDPNDSYTIVNKWDLVCDKQMYNQLSQVILVVGVMIGAFFFSVLSDRFGRKPVFLSCHMMMVVIGTACALVGNMYVFLALRFITGMLNQGIQLTGFVLVCELFPMKQRTLAGVLINFFWGFGSSLIAFFAYVLPNWVHLQLVISLSGILTIPLFWFMSESVPWLYANGRVDEAEQIIRRAARINKIELSGVIFKTKDVNVELMKKGGVKYEQSKNLFSGKKPTRDEMETSFTILDFIKNPKLLTYLVITSFDWISITLVYFGLTFGVDISGRNRFLSGFFIAFIELPAYGITYFLIERFGRKKPLIALLTVSGIFVLLTFAIPKTGGTIVSYIPIVLSLVGKFCISVCFAIIFLYSSEIFPTNLRNQAIGINSFFGRSGTLLATFTVYFMELYPTVPILVFSSISFLTALLTFFLPETLNRPLPNTLKEIESWTRTVADPNGKNKEKSDDIQMNYPDLEL